jgi:phosphoglycolate phosphatase-like HAD superfamily hydrolase
MFCNEKSTFFQQPNLVALFLRNAPTVGSAWKAAVGGATAGVYFAMSSSIPSVLLDLDGTLIDSQPGIMASCLAALRALGHEPEATLDIAAIIGPPVEDVMRILFKPYRDDRVNEAVAAYRKDYGVHGLFESNLYPGIAEVLHEMLGAGARLYLATSKRTIFARRILEHLDLAICSTASMARSRVGRWTISATLSPTFCLSMGYNRDAV